MVIAGRSDIYAFFVCWRVNFHSVICRIKSYRFVCHFHGSDLFVVHYISFVWCFFEHLRQTFFDLHSFKRWFPRQLKQSLSRLTIFMTVAGPITFVQFVGACTSWQNTRWSGSKVFGCCWYILWTFTIYFPASMMFISFNILLRRSP